MSIIEEEFYLYFLLIIPIMIAIYLVVLSWKKRQRNEFGNYELIKKLMPERSNFKQVLKFIFLLLGISMIIIGLSNPKFGNKTESIKSKGIDIVFALDVSKSMLAKDVLPSRLEKGKQIISQIINQLDGDRIGIIAYSGNAFPVLPITYDYRIAKMFLQDMNPKMVSSQGTSIDQAIEMSIDFFENKKKSNKVLIIISDGEDHTDNAINAAKTANSEGIKIITIGIGTQNGGTIPLDEYGLINELQKDKEGNTVITKRNSEILKQIAEATNENYIDGNETSSVISYLKTKINKYQKNEYNSTQVIGFQSQFQWFLGFGFFFLFLDIFLLKRRTKWIRKLNLFNEEK